MDFRVPPTKYRLVVTSDKPMDAFGRPRLADVDFTTHQIKVWGKLHGRARENLVREELDIAWHRNALFNKLGHGVLADESAFFENDLRRQGGRLMLDHARPARAARPRTTATTRTTATPPITKTGLTAIPKHGNKASLGTADTHGSHHPHPALKVKSLKATGTRPTQRPPLTWGSKGE